MQEPPTSITEPSPSPSPRFVRSDGNGAPPQPPPPARPKLKKLRLALVVLGLSALALISTVFGMLMAVASDLPALDNEAQYRAARNSVLYPRGPECQRLGDKGCTSIGKLTGNLNRILVTEGEISPNLKNAVIAIEDRRFYSHHGVDYAGIARALWQDVLRRQAAQGGSTITQQFVKNALSAQNDRSVFQKLREAALAYHLERKWSKEKILTQYLNTVYFGNGAYGVEAAARTYFGDAQTTAPATTTTSAGVTSAAPPVSAENQPNPDRRDARLLSPAEAALLAGMISSPSMYDPLQHPQAARQRRDLVLNRMYEQKMITRSEYTDALRQSLPGRDQVNPPHVDSQYPYFTSWVEGQLLQQFQAPLVYSGGLHIQTTIDPELQAAAESAIRGRLAGIGPSASLVAIDNKTGEVRAMVGGTDFDTRPFNLATNGHRQPGSAIKPFILVRALADGVDPNSSWASSPKTLYARNGRGQKIPFKVTNYDDNYLGTASLWSATTNSDNSVFAELGLKTGTKRIARLAEKMGIRTRLSTNPSMTLGGLKEGVSPLEMAYAYSTIANEGVRMTSSLAPDKFSPIGFTEVKGGRLDRVNEVKPVRVYSQKVGELAKSMLHLVVTSGTGKAAQVGTEYIWGKTGTTENYGDAWFVGGNDDLTVAVWVGYADKVQSMETEHAGSPVAGGTFPAEIFHDFMTSWLQMRDTRRAARHKGDQGTTTGTYTTTTPATGQTTAPQDQQQTNQTQRDHNGQGGAQQQAKPAPDNQQQQQTPPPDTQTPAAPNPQTPPPTGGGGTSPGGGASPGQP
jgi:penicillin-binding protein 1A